MMRKLMGGLLFAFGLFAFTPLSDAQRASDPRTAAYLEQAGISDLFEIESSNLALAQSADADVQTFARMMSEDHTKSTARLKAAAGTDGVPLKAPVLDREHKSKLDQLKAAKGAEFDKLYLTVQAAGHEQALSLHRDYAAAGTAPALKAAAGAIAPVVQMHLSHVTALIEKRAR